MSERTKLILILILFLIMVLVLIKDLVYGKDRCQDYVPDVRQYATQYLGPGFPYWYNIGCAITETNCRADLVSFDGGIGLFQFTPSTGVTKEISRYFPIDPYNVQSSIRAQAFYIHLIRDKKLRQDKIMINKHEAHPNAFTEYCGSNLADVYRWYNGGVWFVYEASRFPNAPFACVNREMFKYCVRGGVWVGSGSKRRWLSFCEVNYSYPEKIYKYAQPYSKGGGSFWHSSLLRDNDFEDKYYAQ